MLGVVRLMLDVDHENGEYAVLLRSDLKGQGLGWKLMKYMIEFARPEGIKTVEGQVLSENQPMLSMCQALGFRIDDDPSEHGVKKVVLDLSHAPTEAEAQPNSRSRPAEPMGPVDKGPLDEIGIVSRRRCRRYRRRRGNVRCRRPRPSRSYRPRSPARVLAV